jgi:alpha-aminoadipate carrier protein LysW
MPPNQGLSARCPECETRVAIPATAELWDMVTCRTCGTELEVVDLDPPELDYWYDPDEDYDDDDFDDDDDDDL